MPSIPVKGPNRDKNSEYHTYDPKTGVTTRVPKFIPKKDNPDTTLNRLCHEATHQQQYKSGSGFWFWIIVGGIIAAFFLTR